MDKEATKIYHDGYAYSKASTKGSKTYWRCVQRYRGCLARLHTNSKNDILFVSPQNHNHTTGTILREEKIPSGTSDSQASPESEIEARVSFPSSSALSFSPTAIPCRSLIAK